MNKFEVALAEKIYARRMTLDLSQEAAADAAGVSRQAWTAWECVGDRHRSPRIEQLPAIARALKYKAVASLIPKFSPAATRKNAKAVAAV